MHLSKPRSRSPVHRYAAAMATYTCPSCDMSVNTTCGHCNAALVDDVLVLDSGAEVRISQCPDGHGKIKSPLCCGTDMACAV